MAFLFDGLPTVTSIGLGELVYEIEVTPPAIDGGEAIPQDHMRSGFLNIFWPRKRRKLGPITLLVTWNTQIYAQMTVNAVPVDHAAPTINKNLLITITFPDAATLVFYGTPTKFEPGAMKEGERPTATLTIQPTLMHPCTGIVVLPVFTNGVTSYC